MNPVPRGGPEPPAAQLNGGGGGPGTGEFDDEDLTGSMAALSGLSIVRLSLEDLLTQVALFAVQAIPGADGAGLTLFESDWTDTVVTSEPFVREIDGIQDGIDEGPRISAAQTGETVRSGELSADPRWPRFGPRAARLRVHSVLTLPLLTSDGGVLGAMNVYARARDAFDDRAQHIGQLFAVPAAIAVQNAQVLAQAQRVTSNLQAALASRAVIDQAIGVIISRTGATPGAAFDRLRTMSQFEHIKLSAVATRIVEEASRRARARRQQPDDPSP